jgi:hypothetical protein
MTVKLIVFKTLLSFHEHKNISVKIKMLERKLGKEFVIIDGANEVRDFGLKFIRPKNKIFGLINM